MLIVTIDKIDANTGKRETLHKIVIANDGTGNAITGNYQVCVQSRDKEDVTAYVRGHQRSRGAVALLSAALEAQGRNDISLVREWRPIDDELSWKVNELWRKMSEWEGD